MTNYPFQNNPEKFATFPKDREGFIVKQQIDKDGHKVNYLIELDLGVLADNLPELNLTLGAESDKEKVAVWKMVSKITDAIVRINVWDKGIDNTNIEQFEAWQKTKMIKEGE